MRNIEHKKARRATKRKHENKVKYQLSRQKLAKEKEKTKDKLGKEKLGGDKMWDNRKVKKMVKQMNQKKKKKNG